MMKHSRYFVFIITLFGFTISGVLADENVKRLNAIANGEHRSDAHKARNPFRNPAKTLDWFGIKDNMTIVEISPGGGGWYSEILAPYLREKGELYVAGYDSESELEYFRRNYKKYNDKLAANPEVYDRVKVFEFAPPKKSALQPEGKADMVLTFRNLHNWVNNGTVDQVFSAIYKVLKPGGALGLVAHRGERHMVGKKWAEKGYIAEAEVIRIVEKAGFQFVDKTEINANPGDTRDHPEGVWTLPPSFRLGDKDRAKYAAIGESDRMTMKFIKPE